MLTKRSIFFPKYASSEQVNMAHYLSMLKTETREFVENTQYSTLAELQPCSRKREIKIKKQRKEKRLMPNQSQLATIWFKSADTSSKVGDQRILGFGKCGNFHDGVFRLFPCHKCGKEGNYDSDCRRVHKFALIMIRWAISSLIVPFSLSTQCKTHTFRLADFEWMPMES